MTNGVLEYEDLLCCDGQLTKNGKSYTVTQDTDITLASRWARPPPEAAVAAWRARLERKRDELLERVRKIADRLAVGVKDEENNG